MENEIRELEISHLVSPLVSICVVSYQHKNFIKQCLEGILMQHVDFEVEIIVHDDASTDGTADIIRKYEREHPNLIKAIYQTENQFSRGVKPMIEIVYPLTKGKYIALCDGDDYWTDPLKLQKQVGFLEANEEYSMCAHDVKTIYEDDWKAEKTNRFNKPINNATFVDLIDNHFIPTNSLIFRNHLIKKWPEWLSSPNMIAGDIPLELMLAFHGKLKYYFDAMAVKRINGGGVTADKSRKLKGMYFKFEMYCNLNHYTKKKYKKILRTKANHLFPRVLYYAIKGKHFKLVFKHFKLYTKTML